ARSLPPPGQGPVVKRGGQGVGHDHRGPAAARHAHALHDIAGLRFRAVDREAWPDHAGGGRHLDADRHSHHAQNDQFRVLTEPRSMSSFVEYITDPELVVMVLAAVAAFATVASFVMPLLSGDRLGARMKYVSTERARLRAERIATMAED